MLKGCVIIIRKHSEKYMSFETGILKAVKRERINTILSWSASILSSTSFQMGKTFWCVVSAAVEQSRCKANIMVEQRDGKLRLTRESLQTDNE